ncbi:hypothetical protein PIB30_069569 [Stylosanthes scabra]|uniref:Uncharacterized protein n=1 Tax=Stylosanthes scabra TaxID=79078 RepID=A0ABU6YQ30_9FABA|nr:hypothetical protein [Stylosanthes scabra]
MTPDKLFSDKSRSSKLTIQPNDSGMGPSNLFLSKEISEGRLGSAVSSLTVEFEVVGSNSLSTKVGVRLLVYSLPQHPTKWDLNWVGPLYNRRYPVTLLKDKSKSNKSDSSHKVEGIKLNLFEESQSHLNEVRLLKQEGKILTKVKVYQAAQAANTYWNGTSH